MMKHILGKFKLNNTTILLLLGGCSAIILLFAAIPPFNFWTFKFSDLKSNLFADYGQFISGFLGSIICLVTIILLYKTLNEQRSQFLMSNFKSNFYSLLENHRKILESIGDSVFDGYPEEHGSDFFCDLAERIAIDFEGITRTHFVDSTEKELKPKFPKHTDLKSIEKLKLTYEYYYNIFQSDLGHYFRNLYHFVRFIENGNIDDDTKKEHLKILRAQLSNYEILLLAYNALSVHGRKFKPLIEKYELLKNLNFEIDLDPQFYKRIIDVDCLLPQFPHLKKYLEQLGKV